MLQIGPYQLASRVVLAPMAGVTDLPFRQLCRRFGAGLVVSEMVTSDSRLWNTRKSQQRLSHKGESEPRAVQIAGNDPAMMANAAKLNVDNGAQIIDINMGCPAKKVCKKAAGSALLKDEGLVSAILSAVVKAVDVPVTLKIRTGWSPEQRNGVQIARIAEDCGISGLAVHGRTRACKFNGDAEYNTIADIKSAISIPVIANGDINSAEKALAVLQHTNADAVMIGRAAQGRPWLCGEIDQFLRNGTVVASPSMIDVKLILQEHIQSLYEFYGEFMGIKISRKHVSWYLAAAKNNSNGMTTDSFRRHFNQLLTTQDQQQAIEEYFTQLDETSYPTNNIDHQDGHNDTVAIHKEVIAA